MFDRVIEEGGRLLPGGRSDAGLLAAGTSSLVRYLADLAGVSSPCDPTVLMLPTTTRITGIDDLWEVASTRPYGVAYRQASALPAVPYPLASDFRQWLGELLTTREVGTWLGLGHAEEGSALATAAVWQLLRAQRTVAEVLRHHAAVAFLDHSGTRTAALLHHLAARLAQLHLTAEAIELVEPELAWPGPLYIPIVVDLRQFVAGLLAPPGADGSLIRYLCSGAGGDVANELTAFLGRRLQGDGLLLLIAGLDQIDNDEQVSWTISSIRFLQQHFACVRMVFVGEDAAVWHTLSEQIHLHCTTLFPRGVAQPVSQ